MLGLMGWVSMCMFNVFLRTFCSSCGGCIFIDRCAGLDTQIMDVSDGSTYW